MSHVGTNDDVVIDVVTSASTHVTVNDNDVHLHDWRIGADVQADAAAPPPESATSKRQRDDGQMTRQAIAKAKRTRRLAREAQTAQKMTDPRSRFELAYRWEPLACAVSPAGLLSEAWCWSLRTALLGDLPLGTAVVHSELLGPSLDQLIQGAKDRAVALSPSTTLAPMPRLTEKRERELTDGGNAAREAFEAQRREGHAARQQRCLKARGFPVNPPRLRELGDQTADEVQQRLMTEACKGFGLVAPAQAAYHDWLPRACVLAARDEAAATAKEAANIEAVNEVANEAANADANAAANIEAANAAANIEAANAAEAAIEAANANAANANAAAAANDAEAAAFKAELLRLDAARSVETLNSILEKPMPYSRSCNVESTLNFQGAKALSAQGWHVGLVGGLGNAHRFLGYGFETATWESHKACGVATASEGADLIGKMLHSLGTALRTSCALSLTAPTTKTKVADWWWKRLSAAPPRAGFSTDCGFGRAYLGFEEREAFECTGYYYDEHALQLLPAQRAALPATMHSASPVLALPPEVAARRQLLALLGSPVLQYVAVTSLVPLLPPDATELSDDAQCTAAHLGILKTLNCARARAHVQRLDPAHGRRVDANGKIESTAAVVCGEKLFALDQRPSTKGAANAGNADANAPAKQKTPRPDSVRSVTLALAGTGEEALFDRYLATPSLYAPEGCTSRLLPLLVSTAVALYRNLVQDAVGVHVSDTALARALWKRSKRRLNVDPPQPTASRCWKVADKLLVKAFSARPPTEPETLASIETALERLDQMHERLAKSVVASDALVAVFDRYCPVATVARATDAALGRDHHGKQAVLQHWADLRCRISKPTGPAKDATADADCDLDDVHACAEASVAASEESARNQALSRSIADGRDVEMPARMTEAKTKIEIEARAAAWQRLARGEAWGDLRTALAQTVTQGPSGGALAF